MNNCRPGAWCTAELFASQPYGIEGLRHLACGAGRARCWTERDIASRRLVGLRAEGISGASDGQRHRGHDCSILCIVTRAGSDMGVEVDCTLLQIEVVESWSAAMSGGRGAGRGRGAHTSEAVKVSPRLFVPMHASSLNRSTALFRFPRSRSLLTAQFTSSHYRLLTGCLSWADSTPQPSAARHWDRSPRLSGITTT